MKNLYFILFTLISFSSRSQVPVFTVPVHDSASTGYYFLNAENERTNLILDRFGNVVYYCNDLIGHDFKIQGNIMTFCNLKKFYLMDSTFTVYDSVATTNLDMKNTHEFQITPAGHFLLLGTELDTLDLSSYTWKGQQGGTHDVVMSEVLQERNELKHVIFEWYTRDYYYFADVDTFWLWHAPLISWTHSNAIERDYDGNFLLSTRNFNEITKINRLDSSIMWRLGGKNNEFTFVNCPYPFYAQHDIRRLPNGHITLFDNGHYTDSLTHGARAVEYELDEVNKICTQVWDFTYDSSMFSFSEGNVQRLANGNTCISLGDADSNDICFVVVDTTGTIIFQVNGIIAYRAFNYPTLPFQLHRPEITCLDSSGMSFLDAGPGYASYHWNNGDSTRFIPITAADTFYVFVPYGGQGGFISSEKFIISNAANPCGTSSVNSVSDGDENFISVFPNPTSDHLNVTYHLNRGIEVSISLLDISNRKIVEHIDKNSKAGNHSDSFDLSNVSPGLFFIKLNQHVMKFVKQQ